MTGRELEVSNAAQLQRWAGRLTAAGARPVLVVGVGQVGAHHGQAHVVECPRITSTDLDGLTCKIHLLVRPSGGAAQRSTSVAWKRTDGGMVRPSASAVLRLMTNSNLLGCSMGRSPGLAPLRSLST